MNTINGWKKTSFGEIATLVKGVSYASEDYCGPDQGAIFLTIKCVSKAGGFKPEGIKYFKGKVADSQELHAGDLLIANTDLTRAGDIVGAPIVVPSLNGETITMSMDLSKVVEDDRKIDRQFLYFMLMTDSVRRFMKDHSSGSTVLHLQTRAVPTLEIGIPNKKSEQAKIAEILSTVDRAIEQTEALIAKQQRIKTGLMHDLLTRGIDKHGNLRSEQTHQFKDSPLGRIPVEWDVIRLDDILILKQYGISTSLTEEPTGVPVLRMNNLVEGEVSYSDLKYSTDPATVNLLLNDGDVLFNRTNSVDYVGRTAIYRQKGTPVSFASYLVRLVPNPTILLSEYLSLWLNDAANQIRVKQLATIGVQQANVNPTNLGTLEVAIPGSLEEQRLIVNAVFTCVGEISSIQKNSAKLRSLRTALMQALFTGKRRVTKL